MNFKKKILTSLFCFIQVWLKSQATVIEWAEQSDLTLIDKHTMACADEHICYVLGYANDWNSFWINKIKDSNPDGQKKNKIPEINGERTNIKGLTVVDGEPLLLVWLVEKKNKTRTFYAYHFNQDLSLKETPGIVSVINNVSRSDYGYSDFFLDPAKKILCFARRIPGDSAKIGFTATDKDQNQLYDFNITLPGTNFSGIRAFSILPDGNLYFTAKIDKPKIERTNGTPDYYFTFYKYDVAFKKIKERKIELDAKYILETTFAQDASGNVICGGTYSLHEPHIRKNCNTFINGFFANVYDKTNDALLTQEVKSIGNDETKPSLLNLNFWDYQLDHIIPMDDGGLMFVTEQRAEYPYGKTFYDAANGILIGLMNLKTHNFGSFEILKNDVGGDKRFTYLLFSQPNKIDLILRGDEDMVKKSSEKGETLFITLDSKNIMFYQVSISNKGKVDKNRVKMLNLDPNYYLDRTLYSKISANTYLISAQTEKGAYRFGRLILK